MTYKNLSTKILRELSRDGRQSLREIAQKLDVSATTIGKRLDQLRDRGILRGITADIDYAKLGYGFAAVTRFKVSGESISRALDILSSHPELTHIYEITGDYDILAIGHFRDREEMNEIIKELQRQNEIQETNTSIVLNTMRENVPPPLEKLEKDPI